MKDEIIRKQEELIEIQSKNIDSSISVDDFLRAKRLKSELAELKEQDSETVSKSYKLNEVRCSNCGKLIRNCDASCYYKEQQPEQSVKLDIEKQAVEYLFNHVLFNLDSVIRIGGIRA